MTKLQKIAADLAQVGREMHASYPEVRRIASEAHSAAEAYRDSVVKLIPQAEKAAAALEKEMNERKPDPQDEDSRWWLDLMGKSRKADELVATLESMVKDIDDLDHLDRLSKNNY